MTDPIRVVVADDSSFVRGLIVEYLSSQSGMQVVATARDGHEAVSCVQKYRPHVITLDLEMPRLDGLGALHEIMISMPTPVIMVSGVSQDAASKTLEAIRAGAVDFVLKYVPGETLDPETIRRDVICKVRAAAAVKVIRAIGSANVAERSSGSLGYDARPLVTAQSAPKASSSAADLHNSFTSRNPNLLLRNDPRQHGLKGPASLQDTSDYEFASSPNQVIVIGASTGGPVAVRQLLENLPSGFPAAIVVVQHIPAAFTEVFAAQIARHIDLPVEIAADGERLVSGRVYVAPGDRHLLVGRDGRVRVQGGPSVAGHRPSIDVAMQSIAHSIGSNVIGVLLTGMGDDGAAGLSFVKAKGGTTLVQDEASCVVNGMPQKAIELDAVDFIGSPDQIANRLLGLCSPEHAKDEPHTVTARPLRSYASANSGVVSP